MSTRDQLTALDATFLELEQANEGALMHIGGALVFDPLPDGGTPTLERVLAHLDTRLELLPRYRCRLDADRTGGLSWPKWVEDSRFDIEAHVRHARLPDSGDEPELLDWISDFYSHRLDRTRPLWEMALLDGLAERRWALVWKTHHCMVDGVGSVDVAHLLFDAAPSPTGAPPAPTREVRGGSDDVLRSWLPSLPETLRQASGAGLSAARAGVHAAAHPREALERSAALVELLVRDELLAAPDSSLNGPIGSTRRIAAVRFALDELKQVRAALGGTVNDAALSAATVGLRRFLLARGETPPRHGLRAMVPVNVRRADERGALGNRIASLFVDLPVAEADPVRAHAGVVAATRTVKDGGQAVGAGTLLGLTELAPPVVHSLMARSLFASRLFNVTITNVPGPRQTLYAFGAPMVDMIPVVPLAADHTLGLAIVSYAGGVTVGLCADRAAVPDLDVLADGIRDAVVDLVIAAAAKSS